MLLPLSICHDTLLIILYFLYSLFRTGIHTNLDHKGKVSEEPIIKVLASNVSLPIYLRGV